MQLDLFEQFGSLGTVYQTAMAVVSDGAKADKTLVSNAQRRIMQQNKFFFIFRDKTLEEIEEIHKSRSGYYFKRSNTAEGSRQLSEWYSAMFTGQTIALERAYRAVDERFLERQKGEFYLEDKKGNKTNIQFIFAPDHFGSESRTTIPTHHLEFRSETPNEISETGYRSHFIQYVPYGEVEDFNDFLIKILRHHFKIKSNIIFENQEFGFGEETGEQPFEVQLFCQECGEMNFKLEEDCPSCGMSLLEDNEAEDYEFEEEDELCAI